MKHKTGLLDLAEKLENVSKACQVMGYSQRTHQGKMCCGRPPFETMREGKQIWEEKFLNQT